MYMYIYIKTFTSIFVLSQKYQLEFFSSSSRNRPETLAQVFSCEFCEISKNTCLHRTPLVVVSEHLCLFY